MTLPLYLRIAKAVAQREKNDLRAHAVGAVAVRADGVLVHAKNGTAPKKTPLAHAESRLMRKCGANSRVYVARVRRDGTAALSRPCASCESLMRKRHVETVYYTISETEWGVIQL